MERIRCAAVTGPTATGKTALAVQLAHRFSGEIISVDSRQVYRGMDIGTGKDLAEYGTVPYHLIDVADPATEEYNLGRFCRDAYAAAREIARRGKLPVFAGGTALYLAALLRKYTLDPSAVFAPPCELDIFTIGVYYPRSEVHKRIEARLDARLAEGLLDEIRRLLRNGVSMEKLAYFGLEYREGARRIAGETDDRTFHDELLYKIRQFAKRQDIFFRKLEREGVDIHWCPGPDRFHEAAALLELFLAGGTPPPPVIRLRDIHYGKTKP